MNIDLIQNLVADIASIPQTGSNQSPEGADFDAMLRQQTQASQPQKAQKPADKSNDKQPAQKPQEDSTQEEITEEGYAVAAGLVTSQPVVLFDVLTPETVQAPAAALVEEAAPVAAENAAAPVQEILAEDAGLSAQPKAEPVQAEQQFVPVEEQAAAPQAEGTVEVAPEAVQPQQEEAPVEVKVAQKAPAHAQQQTSAVEEEAPETADVEVWTGRPLFQPEAPAPVKVADNYEAIPLEEEGAQEQLSNRLANAIEQGQSRVELQLNPASLGKLTVEITQNQNGDISIVFRPETVRAAQILSNSHFTGLMENKDGNLNLSRAADIQIVYPEQPEDHANQFLNPDGQNRQQQSRQQQEKKHKGATEDFIQQLRLGLVNAAEG